MKRLKVSRTKNFKNVVDEQFSAKGIANRLLLDSGFEEGQIAQMKYANGHLTIVVGKLKFNE